VRPGVRVCQLKNILWWHWDRHAVVEVAGARHLRVDDERRVPRITAALRPHKVERLEGDVDGGHSGIVLVATEIGILWNL